MDITYDFYNEKIMHAVEWNLNAMINKNKNLINRYNETWRLPFN